MDEEKKYGIEALKIVGGAACDLVNDVLASMEDGKFNLADFPRFLDNVLGLPKVIKAAPSVDDEWLDIDVVETVEYETFIVGKLKLPSAATEEQIKAIIKATITLVMRLASVYKGVLALVAAIKGLKTQY
jgi:hypothetical protein